MFARVSIYDFPGDRANEAVESFRPALESISAAHGFGEAFFFVSREAGRGLVLTLWRDHEGMTASNVSATRLRGEAIRAVDGEVLTVNEYELALHVEAPTDAAAPTG